MLFVNFIKQRLGMHIFKQEMFMNLRCVSQCLSINHFQENDFLKTRHPVFSKSIDQITFKVVASFKTSKFLQGNCWKCDKFLESNSFFCSECTAIQRPPEEPDYYALLGLRKSFEVSDSDLTNSFRRTQMLLHPDKFSIKSDEEHAIAEEYSSLINKAYSTLRHPWKRGVYLLRTFNIEFDEETSVDDPNLLMQVMERNEAVADASELTSLLSIEEENNSDISQINASIALAFHREDLEEAKKGLIKLKYFTNVESKIKERKLEFGAVD